MEEENSASNELMKDSPNTQPSKQSDPMNELGVVNTHEDRKEDGNEDIRPDTIRDETSEGIEIEPEFGTDPCSEETAPEDQDHPGSVEEEVCDEDSEEGLVSQVDTVMPPPAPADGVPKSRVIGSLTAELSDDSDSDVEEDDDEGPLHEPLNLVATGNDSDGELEVNSDITISLPEKKNKTAEESRKSANPLADAMDAAIDSVSEQTQAFSAPTNESKKSSSSHSYGTKDEDFFGISYSKKKTTKAKSTDPNYAIIDKELEKELEGSIVSGSSSLSSQPNQEKGEKSNSDGGDDFDFDFESRDATADSIDEPSAFVAKAEDLKQKVKEDELQIIEQMRIQTQKEREENERQREQQMREASEQGTVQVADPEALAEMHEMYKKGLGDQSILLDERAEDETSGAEKEDEGAGGSGELRSPTLCLIEEGDEEEEERLEVEAENKETIEKVKEQQAIEKEEEVWESVSLVHGKEAKSANANEKDISSADEKINVVLPYKEAMAHFQSCDYIYQYMNDISPEELPPANCMSCFSKPKLSFPNASKERDQIFCLAKCPLDDKNTIHMRMLQTLYKKFLGSNCSRLGIHWQSIGFQGNDPATDLRSVGVYSLLQMISLLHHHNERHRLAYFALRFHVLSEDAELHFPMMCVSINFSLQCLFALRSGALYDLCNEERSIHKAMDLLHSCLCYKLYSVWKRVAAKDKFPFILNEILDNAKKEPLKVIQEYQSSLNKHIESEGQLSFTEIQ